MVEAIKEIMGDVAPKQGDTQAVTLIKLTAALGLPSVLVIVYLWFISIPDADARRAGDKQVNQTLYELSRNFTLLNEQSRSTLEASHISIEAVKELRLALGEQTKSIGEQTEIMRKTQQDQVRYWEEYNRSKAKQ